MKSQADSATLSRRRLFAGAGAAGAVAGLAAVVPRAPEVPAEPVAARPAPEAGGGYQLSEHVKRYYQTTRV